MSNSTCYNKIQDIIILGAGASASDGAPVQNNLFRDYFKLSRNDPYFNDGGSHERLSNFFEVFFGINPRRVDIQKTQFPTFEEALGILEIALNREENFRGYSSSTDQPDIQRVREDLIFLMAITIGRKVSEEVKYHKKLIKRLDEQKMLSKTAFISLNYDILIDNVLADLYPNYDLDYGVEFTNFELFTNDWERPNPEKSIFLYKLHGSLNWLYCPTCKSLTLTPKKKSAISALQPALQPKTCICGGKMIPIIIPPTFFKVMSNYYLQKIWHQAEISLRKAKRIIFCGYSFSDADIHVKYLLKRAEINNGNTPEIYIMNTHSTKTEDEKKVEKEKYKRFFNVKENVHYIDQSFEDFCSYGINSRKEM